MDVKNQRGQTVVEYILLLAVALSLVFTVFRSTTFQRLFGSKGRIGQVIKAGNEFSYRHAYHGPDTDVPRGTRDASRHPSYYDTNIGGSRFFTSKEPYGQ